MKIFFASALLLSAAAYLAADPVEVWIEPVYQGIPPASLIGTINCSQFAVTSAACETGFSNFTGTIEASANVTAKAGFGSASGSANGGGDISPGVMYYLASFANDVVVTGGTGKGTLIVQYQITAGSGVFVDPSTHPDAPLASPQFTFVQGSNRENIDTNLIASVAYINESVNVTSSFHFGAPFAFGAETQAVVDDYYSALGTGVDASGGSSLQLTGFTVLDSSGHVVAGAQIIPGQALGTGIFTPEPLSGSLALLGLALLAWPAARARVRE